MGRTGRTIKRKVYQDVSASKVGIKDAKHFAEYANQTTNVKVEYLQKSEVITNNISDAALIKGTLIKLHCVDHISPSQVEFYNSMYKNVSPMFCSINYDESESSSDEEEASSEEGMSTYNRDSTSEDEEYHSSIGDIVISSVRTFSNILG